MEGLFEHVLSNSLAATLLAAAALTVGWLFRKPALTHALWLLVLAKLLTPGIAEVSVPAPSFWRTTQAPDEEDPQTTEPNGVAAARARQAATAAATGTGWASRRVPGQGHWTDPLPASSRNAACRLQEWSHRAVARGPQRISLGPDDAQRKADSVFATAGSNENRAGGSRVDSAPAQSPPQRQIGKAEKRPAVAAFAGPVTGLWAAGALLWFLWSAWRVGRFRRWLGHGWLAPREIQRLTETLAQGMGLGRSPKVFLAAAPISPMIFWWGSAPRLLFPAELACRLDRPALESLLRHELAHLKRRDHWVRLIETLVTGLYWWHPLVWIARWRLHCAEEECCDALVVSQSGRRTYAMALLATLDYLAEWRPAFPPAACGLGQYGFLKRRLLLIMQGAVRGRLTRGGRAAAAFACLILPISIKFTSSAPGLGPPRTAAVSSQSLARSDGIVSSESGASGKSRLGERSLTPARQSTGSGANSNVIGAQVEIGGVSLLTESGVLVAVDSPHANGSRIRAWRLDDLALVHEIDEPRGVESLAISPGGEWLIWANGSDVIKFASFGVVPAPAPFFVGDCVTRLAISSDLSVLALAHELGEVSLWRPAAAEKRMVLSPSVRDIGVSAAVRALSLSRDGAAIAALVPSHGARPGAALIWRHEPRAAGAAIPSAARPPQVSLPAGDQDWQDALLSGDGQRLALIAGNGDCRVWRLDEIGDSRSPLESSDKAQARAAALSPFIDYHDILAIGRSSLGEFVAVSDREGEIQVWSSLRQARRSAPLDRVTQGVAVEVIDGTVALRSLVPSSADLRQSIRRGPARAIRLAGLSRYSGELMFVDKDAAGAPMSLLILR